MIMNELIKRAQNGDKEAMELVMEENKGLVRQMMKKLTGNSFDDDFYSVGLFGLYNGIMGFDETKGFAFSTYAGTCIIHHIQLEQRRNKAKKRTILTNAISMETVILSNDKKDITVADTLADELAHRRYNNIELPDIESAIDQLSEFERQIVDLYFFQGLKQSEIAEMLNLPNQVRVSREVTKIRNKLARICKTEVGLTRYKKAKENK